MKQKSRGKRNIAHTGPILLALFTVVFLLRFNGTSCMNEASRIWSYIYYL